METALSGLTVIDFSPLLPGPYASMLLADMGATVIRIESMTRPDMLRQLNPQLTMNNELCSAAHIMINRNKSALAIDLKHPKAKEIIYKLVADADIVLEQFRPGVMDRLGLGYEQLRTIQPQLIYCAITGFGQVGPNKDTPGHDINYLALSGLASYSGTENTGPVLSGVQVADLAGGSHHAVIGILSAVIQRDRQAIGHYLDISMTNCAFALNALFAAGHLATNTSPSYSSEILNGQHIYGYYLTQDQQYLAVGCLEPEFINTFMLALNKPEWLSTITTTAGMTRIKAQLTALLQTQSLAYWLDVFSDPNCCVSPVLDLQQAANSAQIQVHHGTTMVTTDHQPIVQISPIFANKHNKKTIKPGAEIGKDSERILKKIGYSAEQIHTYRKQKIIR